MMVAVPLLLLANALSAAPYTFDPNVPEELRARDGLPNVLAKLQAGGTVRIAYFGGSITAAAGWRPKTLAWFREQYPAAKVEEINAAISGTGSDYGACRVRGDVLARQPDLVFLECRVNGGGGYERQSVEGIVRQIWTDRPRTDICFVYTLHQGMLKDLQAGRAPWFTPVMETIANTYGIPTIDLGLEIARRESEGSLIFKAPAPVTGKLVFTADGVHPGDAGHGLYRDVIARSIGAMKTVGRPGDHVLPAPLMATCWQTAGLLPVERLTHSTGWQPVDRATDKVYRDDFGRTEAMLRGAMKCDRTGETFTVRWNGTTLGVSDIPYGEPMEIEAVVDGGQPIQVKRPQQEKIRKYARFWYLPELPAGPHTAVFTVKHLPAGNQFYCGQVLVVGTLLP